MDAFDAPDEASAPDSSVRLLRPRPLRQRHQPQGGAFFLAFLATAVDPARGDAAVQTLPVRARKFTLQAAVLFALLGLFSGHVGAWLKRHGRAGLCLDRIAGTVFVGLGVKLAVGN